jgi:hypothetical protein
MRTAANRSRRTIARASATAACLAAAFVPRAAEAQALPQFDARTFRPPVDPHAGFVLEPVTTPGHLRANVGVWTWYALDPMDVRVGGAWRHAVEHQVGADVVANVGLGQRFALGADLPVFWGEAEGDTASWTGIGDLSLLAKATVISNDQRGLLAGLGLSALAEVTLPTGDRAGFMSDGAVTASLRWLVEYSLGVAAVRGSAGFLLRPDWRTGSVGDGGEVTVGNAVPWSLGIMLRPKAFLPAVDPDDRQEWEIAARGALPAGPVAPFGWGGGSGATALSPALLSLGDRVALGRHHDAYLVAGADFGVDRALGVPLFRAVVAIGWAPRVHDRDGDGVDDDADQCPDLPEDKDGVQDQDGCPEDDADGDGIPDEQDACPVIAGTPSNDPKRNGCPSAPPAVPQ